MHAEWKCSCFWPEKGVVVWRADQDPGISSGSLASIVGRFVLAFEPMVEAALVHQKEATERYGEDVAGGVVGFAQDQVL